jgi:hypothetical protein
VQRIDDALRQFNAKDYTFHRFVSFALSSTINILGDERLAEKHSGIHRDLIQLSYDRFVLLATEYLSNRL